MFETQGDHAGPHVMRKFIQMSEYSYKTYFYSLFIDLSTEIQ